MTPEELRDHTRELAKSRCKAKHRDYYDSLICVGPGSTRGFGPPCSECLAETESELEMKRAKAHGRKLSSEEATELRKRLGMKE